MIEALAATLESPPAYHWEAKTRRRKDRRSQDEQQSSNAEPRRFRSGYYIGAIILLSGDDGSEYACRVTHQTPDGQWWCEPQ